MELRAKQRMHALDDAISQNALLSRKMAAYDASQLGIQIGEEPEVGQIIDESDKALDNNFIRQQFVKNVFRLFRNNTVSAQDFIELVSEDDYSRFNTIFPQLIANLGGLLNVDVRSAYNMTRMLMITKVPKEKAAAQQPLPSVAEAYRRALEPPEAIFIDTFTYKEMVKCLLPECSKSVPFRNTYRARLQHNNSHRHKAGLQIYQDGIEKP